MAYRLDTLKSRIMFMSRKKKIWCKYVAQVHAMKLFRGACWKGVSGLPCQHGPSRTNVLLLALCLSNGLDFFFRYQTSSS